MFKKKLKKLISFYFINLVNNICRKEEQIYGMKLSLGRFKRVFFLHKKKRVFLSMISKLLK